jgi:hypothetical protein
MTIQGIREVRRRRQPARHGGGPTMSVLVGGLCGLAWAAGLRGFMAQVAGSASEVDWAGTFGLRGRRGRRRDRRLAVRPARRVRVVGQRATLGADRRRRRGPDRHPVWAVTVTSFAGSGLALDTARGAWVAVYYWSFLAVLALACAIPHRAVTPQDAA